MSKVNILFAIADDASHFGCYGHKFVNTPCIDNLAQQGVIFNNAFTTNPKCGPSRCSILSGLHTWGLNEGCDHFGYFPNNVEVFPDILENNGYNIAYTGKGWEPGDWKRCGRKRNPAGNNYAGKTIEPPINSKISNCDYSSNFDTFLDDSEDTNKPFFFWYGCYEPHRPYTLGEGGKSEVKSSDLPPYFPDCDEVKQDICDYSFEINNFDKHLSKMVSSLEERNMLKNTIIIITSDNGAPFPRVKGQMYEDDFHLPLIIYRGEDTFSHTDDKKNNKISIDDIVSFVDFFPTILDYAHINYSGLMDGVSLRALLNNIDKPRNNYAIMGKERHDVGREDDKGYPVRCIRDDNYLYCWNIKPDRWPAGNPETNFTNCDSSVTKDIIINQYENGDNYLFNLSFGKRVEHELYCIKTDPHCMINLAKNNKYESILKDLKEKLIKDLIKTQDPRIMGKGDKFDEYEYVGEDNHSWKNFIEGTWTKQNF